MDTLIDKECVAKGFTLDFGVIKEYFQREDSNDDPIDSHVMDTLASMLDFLKFKEMMLAFKAKENNPQYVANEEISNWTA